MKTSSTVSHREWQVRRTTQIRIFFLCFLKIISFIKTQNETVKFQFSQIFHNILTTTSKGWTSGFRGSPSHFFISCSWPQLHSQSDGIATGLELAVLLRLLPLGLDVERQIQLNGGHLRRASAFPRPSRGDCVLIVQSSVRGGSVSF